MSKDYTSWMPVKAGIHNANDRPLGFNERDVWLCSIGDNVGHENDGKGARFARPVVVVKSYNAATAFIVPLSTTAKRTPYHFAFDSHTGKNSVALLSQGRTIDTKRLYRKIGYISSADFIELKKRIVEALGLA